MSWLDQLLRRGVDTRSDLDEEVRFHLAEETRLRTERGQAPSDAQRAARDALGSLVTVHEQIESLGAATAVEGAWQDIRFGARMLRRSPGFAAVAIASLALGIGANAAIFQVLDAIRLRSLPVHDPGTLAEVRIADKGDGDDRGGNFTTNRPELTHPLWERIRNRQQAFSSVFAWASASFELASGGESERVPGLFVSGSYFGTLEAAPELGRLIGPADDERGCASPGAVLGDGFWRRRYGADPEVVGRTVRVDGQVFPVIGVAPAGFHGVEIGSTFDVALPVCAEPLTRGARTRLDKGDEWWLAAIGHLKPGWSIERASAQLHAISVAIFADTVPVTYGADAAARYRAFHLGAFPASTGVSDLRRTWETPLWLLLGLAAVVLMIACANLANLLLARATAREREIALRLATGASRGRVVRQLLAESLLLAVIGSGLGLLLARSIGGLSVSLLGSDVVMDLHADWRVLGFTSALAVGACVLFGLAPAMRATRDVTAAALRSGGRGSTAGVAAAAMRRGLVVFQIALSFVLVVGALLFVRTLQNLMHADLGFTDEGVLTMTVDLRRTGAAGPARRDLLDRLRDQVGHVPGVRSVAASFLVPISGSSWNQVAEVGDVGRPRVPTNLNQVSPGYFAAMGTPLLAGRDFDDHDTADAPPVAIVNQAFARAMFHAPRPLGRRFRFGGNPGEPRPAYEVIGIAGDSKYGDVREEFGPIVYLAADQDREPSPFSSLIVRAAGAPASVASAVTAAITDVDPNILIRSRTLSSIVDRSLERERLMATLSSVFGGLAGVLAAIGLSGVMAYVVARRRVEIGVRMALGATRRDVMRLVLREATVLLVAGLGAGIPLAIAGTRAIGSLLYDLHPGDPAALAMSAAGLATVTLLASYVPARRAAGVEPTIALRAE